MLSGLSDLLHANENCCFVTHRGGRHDYRTWSEDLYNLLRLFFHSGRLYPFAAETKVVAGAYDVEKHKGEIIFYGASNFARWTDMEQDLAPFRVQNHGFGGSSDTDLMFYAEELLFPYEPKAVFFQTGSNDYVQLEGTDEEKLRYCMEKKRNMFETFHQRLPKAKFVVMSGLLLPGREEYRGLTEEINFQLSLLCAEKDYMTFVDASDMTYSDEGFRTELFVDDLIHLNREGQLLWAEDYILPVLRAMESVK